MASYREKGIRAEPAHLAGPGAMAFHPKGKLVYTVGADGAVRWYDALSLSLLTDDEAPLKRPGGAYNPLMAIAFAKAGDQYVTGAGPVDAKEQSETALPYCVDRFTWPANAHEDLVTRLTGSVYALAYAPNGNQLAVGGERMDVKLVNTVDTTAAPTSLHASAYVKHVAYDPSGTWLATGSTDGTLALWALHTPDKPVWAHKLMSTSKPEIKDCKQQFRMDWSPDGKFLAVPTSTGAAVLSAGTWATAVELKADALSVVAWSPNGTYLAAADEDGKLTVWDVATRQVLNTVAAVDADDKPTPVLGVQWSPLENALFFFTQSGALHRWPKVVPDGMASPIAAPTATPAPAGSPAKPKRTDADAKQPHGDSSKPASASAAAAAGAAAAAAPAAMEDDDDDDEFGVNVLKKRRQQAAGAALEKSDAPAAAAAAKSGAKPPAAAAAASSAAGATAIPGASSAASGTAVGGKRKKPTDYNAQLDDYLATDDVDKAADAKADGAEAEPAEDGDAADMARYTKKLAYVQPAFQPGATPGKKHKYMCWNLIGSVVCHEEPTHALMEVQFTDTAKSRGFKIKDFHSSTAATLSDRCLFMAAPASGDDAQPDERVPASVYYLRINAWGRDKEWRVWLPDEEVGEVVAAGDDFVAVSTNRALVRVLSHTAVQLMVWSAAGAVVTMAAHGQMLAVFYHAGHPMPGQQNIAVALWDIKARRCLQTVPCALSPGSTLRWAAFSEHNMLLTMDSQGMFRGLSRAMGYQWAPLLDPQNYRKPGTNDVYWPVGLLEDNAAGQKMMVAVCKNGAKFPLTNPKPVLSAVPLQLPLCEMDKRTSQAEEQYARTLLLAQETAVDAQTAIPRSTQRALDTIIVRLIDDACRSDKEMRAVDLSVMLVEEQMLEIAQRLATTNKRVDAADRIGRVAQIKASLAAQAALAAATASSTSTSSSSSSSSASSSANKTSPTHSARGMPSTPAAAGAGAGAGFGASASTPSPPSLSTPAKQRPAGGFGTSVLASPLPSPAPQAFRARDENRPPQPLGASSSAAFRVRTAAINAGALTPAGKPPSTPSTSASGAKPPGSGFATPSASAAQPKPKMSLAEAQQQRSSAAAAAAAINAAAPPSVYDEDDGDDGDVAVTTKTSGLPKRAPAAAAAAVVVDDADATPATASAEDATQETQDPAAAAAAAAETDENAAAAPAAAVTPEPEAPATAQGKAAAALFANKKVVAAADGSQASASSQAAAAGKKSAAKHLRMPGAPKSPAKSPVKKAANPFAVRSPASAKAAKRL